MLVGMNEGVSEWGEGGRAGEGCGKGGWEVWLLEQVSSCTTEGTGSISQAPKVYEDIAILCSLLSALYSPLSTLHSLSLALRCTLLWNYDSLPFISWSRIVCPLPCPCHPH